MHAILTLHEKVESGELTRVARRVVGERVSPSSNATGKPRHRSLSHADPQRVRQRRAVADGGEHADEAPTPLLTRPSLSPRPATERGHAFARPNRAAPARDQLIDAVAAARDDGFNMCIDVTASTISKHHDATFPLAPMASGSRW